MKRTLVALLVVGLCGAVSAHIGGLVYPMYEIATSELPDIWDGSTDDWTDVLPGTSLNQDEFAALDVADGAPVNVEDLAYQTWFAWHYGSQTVWMAIERVDDSYINTYAGGDLINLWRFDCIEFMMDGDHSGGHYNGNDSWGGPDVPQWEKDLYANYQGQQYIALPESPDNRQLGYQGKGQDWVCQPPFADAGGFSEDAGGGYTRSVIEMYVTPWDECVWQGSNLSKRSSLNAGQIVGFQISVPDFDTEAGAYHAFHTLSGQPNTWRIADNFVDGELIGCDYEDCSQSDTPAVIGEAVKADSWGRIKASVQ
jgi:hypothetical protein